MPEPCPCDRKRRYADCCGPLHAGAPAPDAQALMRSRYSAYVRGDADYLLATWHPSTRPVALPLDPATKWLRLDVLGHRMSDAGQAEVSFEARFIDHGRHMRMRERSRFVHEDGRWFYVDGEAC